METTIHAQGRMAQRGISLKMVEYVLSKGTPSKDKVIMGKKDALQILEELQEEQRLVKKILDKGGVVVVANGNTFITTYNRQGRSY